MKTLGIISYIRPDCSCGGIEDHVFQLLSNIDKTQYNLFVIYCKTPRSDEQLQAILKYCSLVQVNCWFSNKLNLPDIFRKIEFNVRLRKITKSLNLDIIQMNGDNGALGISKKIVSVQYGATSIGKYKIIVESRKKFQIKKRVETILSASLEFIAARRSDQIIIDNPTISSIAHKMNPKVPIKLIYDAIDSKAFYKISNKNEIKKKLDLKLEFKYGIWVSTDYNKGLNDAINAFKPLKNSKLLVVGFKPHGNFRNVQYLGFLNHEQLNEYLNASDFFILPTKIRTLDLAVIDALHSGLTLLLKSVQLFLV